MARYSKRPRSRARTQDRLGTFRYVGARLSLVTAQSRFTTTPMRGMATRWNRPRAPSHLVGQTSPITATSNRDREHLEGRRHSVSQVSQMDKRLSSDHAVQELSSRIPNRQTPRVRARPFEVPATTAPSSQHLKSIVPMPAANAVSRKVVAVDSKDFARLQRFGSHH
jgi:hypothetical protein